MAKRSSTPKRSTSSPARESALERQVLAFAEQLGYVAGSIESRTAALTDRQKLSRQLTGVRDGAKRLLEQLGSGVASRVRRAPKRTPPARKARSGGAVDAPGKKHRKPAPSGPPPAGERARNARIRAATPVTNRASHRARQG
jgi:hypothetical protein